MSSDSESENVAQVPREAEDAINALTDKLLAEVDFDDPAEAKQFFGRFTKCIYHTRLRRGPALSKKLTHST